jgi:protocatechuate 3,4-dioxygenase beta subunit
MSAPHSLLENIESPRRMTAARNFPGGRIVNPNPLIHRRAVLASAAAVLLPAGLASAVRDGRVVTPNQTEGPFYPTKLPVDTDND